MKDGTKGLLKLSGAGVAFVAAITGAIVLGQTLRPADAAPEPTPAAVSVYEVNGFAEAPEKVVPEPVAAEAPPVPVVEAPVEEPVGPDLCPPGTSANSSDGYNDLSCMPDVCGTLRGLPDPAYPECDYFYPPEYYR